MTSVATKREREAFAWLLGFVKPFRRRLIAVLLLSLFSTGLGLAQPYITRYLIDDGLLQGRFELIVWLCALMFALGLASSLLGALNRWYHVDISARILHRLRESVFSHLTRLSPLFYAHAKSAGLITRVDDDMAEIQRFSVDTLLASVNAFIALAGTLVLMLSLSWRLSLIALLLLPGQLVFLRLMRPHIERLSRTVRDRTSGISSFFFETLSAMKFIQSVAAEKREVRHLQNLNEVFRADILRSQMTNYAASAIPALITSLGMALVFIAGGYMVIQGSLSIGALIAFAAYLVRAAGSLQSLLGLDAALQRARVSLQRVVEVAAAKPAVQIADNSRRIAKTARGMIRFEQVSFTYREDLPNVLNNIDIVLPAGKKIALAGVSGVGKSTLIDLLHRHYDPSRGRILLDDIDLRELDLMDLRRRIAIVSQDTVLLSGSILENIRYAAPEASDAIVGKAAKLAQVDEFASQLPQGYNSTVGKGGAALSGAQRQRIAIARALLQEPLVLILDEATSAVDQKPESDVIELIDRLFAKRTRLIIGHREQTVPGADMALELVAGYLLPPGMKRSEQETVH